jgi:sortase A
MRRPRPRAFAALVLAQVVAGAAGALVLARTGTPTDPPAGDNPMLVAATPPSTAQPTTTSAPPPTTAPAPAPSATPVPRRPHPDGRYRDNGPVVQIGTIEIPKIGLVHPVFEGNTLTQIDHGPSHWPGTALPGQAGNAVFAGHRVTHTRPFRNIDQLVPGDLVHFVVGGVRTTYRVTESFVVTPKDTWIINQTPTPTATLFACHPPGSARYRYVVRLALVS